MDGELRWAVTDGPEGSHAVVLPDDVPGARRLVAHYRGRFWCSTRAGGCGERLFAGAGFRHRAADSWCRFARSGTDAGLAYEHLRYEPALTRWLAGQGHQPRARTLLGPAGAADLQLVVDELDAVLEVQLAPLPDAAWRERDDADRRQHRHVTWLYGPGAGDAAATEAAVRGFSLELRRQNRGLLVGVRDVDGGIRWIPVTACRLSVDGFTAPGIAEARLTHARRMSERRAAARRAARHAPARTGALDQLPFPA
ncbi:hypothetical protein [Geodermatophilus sp. URMC 64]